MLIAITRPVSPSIVDCELLFHERRPIDPALARRQHEAYCDALRELGANVVAIPAAPELPDAVFVEDTTVVVEELAVLTAPLVPARRREVASMTEALAAYRPLHALEGTATLEGGDVLRIGRALYAGRSQRTNEEGIRQLADALAPHGYQVVAVPIEHCLHLKSAVTSIGKNTLLANPDWVDLAAMGGEYEVISVAPEEPNAANALLIDETVILPASFPRTRKRLEKQGCMVRPVDVSELQKAEGGVTCCSVLLRTA